MLFSAVSLKYVVVVGPRADIRNESSSVCRGGQLVALEYVYFFRYTGVLSSRYIQRDVYCMKIDAVTHSFTQTKTRFSAFECS